MPVQASSVRAARGWAVRWWGPSHRLVGVARELCASHSSGPVATGVFVCGRCWEHAVRAEVRAALGAEPVPVGPVRAGKGWFGPSHPLASVAARLCREHMPVKPRKGFVACGPCWERAIVADERVVVEFGLPRELVAEPDLVDETAVRLALAGESVELTPVEQAVVAERLAQRRQQAWALLKAGWAPWQVAARLGIPVELVPEPTGTLARKLRAVAA